MTWVAETGSGKDMKRRVKLEAALALLDDGDVLVVAKLARLSRSVRDLAEIVERSRRGRWSLVLLDFQLSITELGETRAPFNPDSRVAPMPTRCKASSGSP